MPRHRLYVSSPSSPYFNTSIGGRSSEGKTTPTQKMVNSSTHKSKSSAIVEGTGEKNKNTKGTLPKGDESNINASDSDSMDENEFFSRVNIKLPYSIEEDETILKFVLKGQNIFRVGSLLLWRELEAKKDKPKRTYQSLKNRFLRNIKPHLFTTYIHLIKDEDTVQKIIEKFPELKKQIGRKETLPIITLPKRVHPQKIVEENRVSSTSVSEKALAAEKPGQVQEETVAETESKTSEQEKNPQPSQSYPQNQNFRRIVKMTNNSLTITLYPDEQAKQNPSVQSSGIYKNYLRHKNKNKLVPCSQCGRCGGPAEMGGVEGSDTESDMLIVDSLEPSKKTQSSQSNDNSNRRRKKSSSGTKFSGERSSKKQRRNNPLPALDSADVNPCSPSLLNEISQLGEISNPFPKKEENKLREADSSKSLPLEADFAAAQQAKEMLSEKDLDILYSETVAHCQKLMDSEEEEALVHNCLKKNCNAFGFQPDLSVQNINVESFFVKSNSPPLESISCSQSSGRTAGEIVMPDSRSFPVQSPLAQNMVKMLGERKRNEEKLTCS